MSISVKSVHLLRCDEPRCLITIECDSHHAARRIAEKDGWLKHGPAERVRHACPSCAVRYRS
jgi:hypothetical protein